ncbi:MAG: hypothetical protein QOJ95_4967 [Mycobacterium sp.]|nr:hypothetical protein [Mycobacterium sp.]
MELVDREHERDTLDMLVASIRAGESRALVVSGDAGVGKTALLDYLLNNAVGDYQTAMTAAQNASDHPGEIVSPTWALVELVEAAARIGESETAAEALRRLEAVTTASGTKGARCRSSFTGAVER